ncbi:hypothetical protein ACI79G_11455 [Geodermatophilus sp. SYSU D00779]
MYPWIWRRLPGPLAVRVTTALVLVLAAAALLLVVVFPVASSHLESWTSTL